MNTYKFIINDHPAFASKCSRFVETKANNIQSAIWQAGLSGENFYLFSITKTKES